MNRILHTVSNYGCTGCNTGNSIMPNGDTAVLAVREYKCSEGTCASSETMLWTDNLNGEVKCFNDDSSCILNGEQTRRGMYVYGNGAPSLTLRALTFKDGEAGTGGGVSIWYGAIVTIELCVYSNCRSTGSLGGGAIYVIGSATYVDSSSFVFVCGYQPCLCICVQLR